MIIKGYIKKTLDQLENLYNKHTSLAKDIYYSKLALLEFCGWIEESMDAIVSKRVMSSLKTSRFKKILRKNIIKENHGFQYSSNFCPMVIKTIGIINAEQIELKMNSTGQIDILSTELGNLKKSRDDNAHTFIRGTTTIIQSPSITKNQFKIIYPILKKYEHEINKH